MNAADKRQNAIRSVWYGIEATGNDPTETDDYTLDLVCQEQAPDFIHSASDNQWKLFLRDFHRRQDDEKAYRAYKARRAERIAR